MKFDDIKGKINSIDSETNAALISEADTNYLVNAVAKAAIMEPEEAAGAIAIICQKGGTSKKAQGTVYAIINSKKLDLALVRRVMNDHKCKFTLRQWARTNANLIYEMCSAFSIEGDLSKKIGRNHPELGLEERVWMSNFQMDNPDCPANVKELLMAHYKGLFPGKTSE